MATSKSTTHPSLSQVTPSAATAQSASCNYCQRPISKRILAGRKPYCGKLCAAMGLISEVYQEDGINNDCAEFDALLYSVFYEVPRAIPVRVRWSDALSFSGDGFPDECNPVIVVIDDDSMPDWVPDPVLDADQDEIDLAVDRLLI